MAKLTSQQIAAALQELSGWTQSGDAIRREFQFEDFVQSMTFVNSVAELAEDAEHHPDIDIRYNKVLLVLSTHSSGGLTGKDVALARQINDLLAA
jgi:4a-hydroxytetrahydrobiopterin dehydratase